MVKLFMVSRICKNWQDATLGWAAKIEGRPESYQSHSLTKLDRATLSNQPQLFVAYGKVKTDFLLPQFLCVKKKSFALYTRLIFFFKLVKENPFQVILKTMHGVGRLENVLLPVYYLESCAHGNVPFLI
jgi:hypothetical protein